MNKDELVDLINDRLEEVTLKRPYAEVGDIIDTEFAFDLADTILEKRRTING